MALVLPYKSQHNWTHPVSDTATVFEGRAKRCCQPIKTTGWHYADLL